MRGKLANCAVGEVLRGKTVRLTLSRVLAFSGGGLDEPGWPHRNIHTDRATAQAAGLPDIIVSGTQFEGILLTHLIGLFGAGWYQGGELEAKIVKSAFVNDEVTPVAVVRDIRGEGADATFDLDVWCERQTGEKLMLGHASARVG